MEKVNFVSSPTLDRERLRERLKILVEKPDRSRLGIEERKDFGH